MTDTAFRIRPRLGPAMALGLALAAQAMLLAPTALAQQEPNGATIQWAQQLLEEKGLYQGRATGRMDAATAAAVASYQRKNGLKATGRLDAPTVAKLLEGRQPDRTVGNLADPGSRARSSSPLVREEDVRPQAAPRAPSVEQDGGSGDQTSLSVGRVAGEPRPSASPPARVEGASPDAAPRAAVEAEDAAGSLEPTRREAPAWLRTALVGLAGAIVVGMLGAWWLSGLRGRRRRSKGSGRGQGVGPAAAGARREPTLGGEAPRPDGRREPFLSASSGGPGANGGKGGLRARG